MLIYKILILISLGCLLFNQSSNKFFKLFQNYNNRLINKLIVTYVLIILLSYLAYTVLQSNTIPLFTLVVILISFFNPLNTFFKVQRYQFLSILLQIISSPVHTPVTFPQVLIADILTSYARVFSDLYLCLLDLLNFDSMKKFSPIFSTIPYLLRFRQCIVEYIASNFNQRRSLANALKYATSFPVIAFSATLKSNEHFYNYWLLSVFINSLYSFWWDIQNDWGLQLLMFDTYKDHTYDNIEDLDDEDEDYDESAPPPPSKTHKPKSFGLRSTLLFKKYYVYYIAIILDFILRFTWSLKLSPHLQAYYELESGILVLEVLEILRRYLWSFFRLEWETIRKSQTTIPFHNYHDFS